MLTKREGMITIETVRRGISVPLFAPDGGAAEFDEEELAEEELDEASDETSEGEDGPETWNLDGLRSVYMGYLCDEYDFRYDDKDLSKLTKKALEEYLMDKAEEKYNEKEALFGEDNFREVERAVLLKSVDSSWMEHIDVMDDLKDTVRLQAYAQRDPVTEYRIQGADLFDTMVGDIRQNTVRTILSVVPRQQPIRRVQVANPIMAGFSGGEPKKVVVKKQVPAASAKTAGRNDPCPCGSGKKYKNCCMRSSSEE